MVADVRRLSRTGSRLLDSRPRIRRVDLWAASRIARLTARGGRYPASAGKMELGVLGSQAEGAGAARTEGSPERRLPHGVRGDVATPRRRRAEARHLRGHVRTHHAPRSLSPEAVRGAIERGMRMPSGVCIFHPNCSRRQPAHSGANSATARREVADVFDESKLYFTDDPALQTIAPYSTMAYWRSEGRGRHTSRSEAALRIRERDSTNGWRRAPLSPSLPDSGNRVA